MINRILYTTLDSTELNPVHSGIRQPVEDKIQTDKQV